MSKLFKLKRWLRLDEAATWLSSVLSEPVSEADILRLALDLEIVLSVYFVESIQGTIGRPVPIGEARRVPGISIEGVPPYEVVLGVKLNDIEVLEFEGPVRHVEGVFDLPMIGGERISCEALYQVLTNGPKVELVSADGVFLREPDSDSYIQIYEDYLPEAKPGDNRGRWERREELIQFPVGTLPDRAIFVVRQSSLNRFLDGLGEAATDEKPVSPKERSSFLNIIGAMLELLQSPRDGRDSDAAVIRELVDNYGEKSGISKSNLEIKFSEAKRRLRGE